MTDDALLQRFATERSNPAFTELVQRHIDLVYSTALPKVGRDAHAASDVVQQVFTALAHQAPSLVGRRQLAGWLFLTTHHHAAQYVRAERRRHARESEAHAMQEMSRRAEIDWNRVRPVLDEVLQQLGGADREAVLLRFFEQRSYAEIGAALQASEDAVRMRVERALEKLRTRLAARGLSSTAAALGAALGQQLIAAPAGLAATVAGNAVLAAAPVAAGTGLSLAGVSVVSALGVAGVIAAFVWSVRPPAPLMPPAAAPVAASPARTVAPAATLVTVVPDKHIVVDANDRAAGVFAPPAEKPPSKKKVPPTRESTMARVAESYTTLIEQLGLNESEAARFRALLAERAGRRYDLATVVEKQRIPADDLDVLGLYSEADETLATALRREFGMPVLEAYQRYSRGLVYSKKVNQLGGYLAATTNPLRPDQAARLREILSDRGGPSPADSAAPWEWARPVLSSAQWGVLQERTAGPAGK